MSLAGPILEDFPGRFARIGALSRIALRAAANVSVFLLIAVASRPVAVASQRPFPADDLREHLRVALWGDTVGSAAALAEIDRLRGIPLAGARAADSREDFLALEEVLREGPPLGGDTGVAVAGPSVESRYRTFPVRLPDGREIPVFVRLPPGYRDTVPHPVLFAMHGGPPGSAEGAVRSATGMVEVWREAAAEAGWIVASPAMTHVRSRGRRTDTRLPYEVLRPAQVAAVLDAVQRRFRVDPDRIVSTGISLGSNFSIAFAASTPDRFAAIVPVSTEGDSREHLLRNLQHVPTYVLEGAQDRNIRAISGPRALGEILARFAYDVTYREFGDRAHEGFQELYPDVLRWLASRPRDPWPGEVLRVPHDGIMPLARRVFWVESATRQGLVRARVVGDNHIDVTARWTESVGVYLHDRLVDLDRPVRFTVNGVAADDSQVRRSLRFAIEQVREHRDTGRAAAAMVRLAVPQTAAATERARALSSALEPVHAEGPLSFWEYYALNALRERFPALGLRAREVEMTPPVAEAIRQRDGGLPAEQVAMELDDVAAAGPFGGSGLRPGDLVIELDGEPFFRDRGGLEAAYDRVLRELTSVPREYTARIWRDGELRTLNVMLRLGDYLTVD